MDDKDVLPELTKSWSLFAAVLAAPLYFLFVYSGDPGRGLATAVSFWVIVCIIRGFWALRHQVWLWVTIAIVILAHILLILSIPFSNRNVPAPILAPIGLADFAIVYGCVRLAQKLNRNRDRHSDTSSTV